MISCGTLPQVSMLSSPNIGMRAGTVILGAGEGSLVVEMDEFYIHKSRLVRHSAKLGYMLL